MSKMTMTAHYLVQEVEIFEVHFCPMVETENLFKFTFVSVSP